jgi:hypothetical protein
MMWQPIETAPKDGTPILAWPCEGMPYVVRWEHRVSGYKWIEAGGEGYEQYEPTNWMPLPEPPKGEGL